MNLALDAMSHNTHVASGILVVFQAISIGIHPAREHSLN